MGIFSKLARSFTKKEKSEEEKLLIGTLVSLKKALKQIEKTQDNLESFVGCASVFFPSTAESNVARMMYAEDMKVGLDKVNHFLDITNNYMKTIEEKIEARAAASSSYRSAAYSGKDKLLLNLVEKIYERNLEVIKDLIAHKKEVKEGRENRMSVILIGSSRAFFSRNKSAIKKSIKDLENCLASS